MIESEDDYWVSPDGTIYKVGDVVPVLRLADVVLFNEKIVKGCCDICDWAIIGPASLVQSYSVAHVEGHVMQSMADEFRHPDYTE